jgi:GNAT superfamily N-acetyltransferase
VDTVTFAIDAVPLGASADLVDAWYEIARAALAEDQPDFPPPCRFRHEVRLAEPWPSLEHQRAVASTGGEPVAVLEIGYPQADNLTTADVDIVVHPRHRRRGAGRALWQYATEAVRDHGRSRIFVTTNGVQLPGGPPRGPAPEAFARAVGLRPGLEEVRRRLELTTVAPGFYEQLLGEARAKAAGYSVVTWTQTTPEEYIDDVAALDSSFLDEAPTGDLVMEAEKVDAERVRAVVAARMRQGVRAYNTGVRHDASGHVVAWSQLVVHKGNPHHAMQEITLVHPGHRGHRLGLLTKLENLRLMLAHEPSVRLIDTWNAAVNQHMIAINEAMGFRAVDRSIDWQIEL